VANPKVTGLMAAFGEAALPALLLDGDIALHGRYPSRDELAACSARQHRSRCSWRSAAMPAAVSGGCC